MLNFKVIQELQKTNCWFDYHKFYTWIAESFPDFRRYVEVGVWKGHSMLYLANLLRDKNVEIYAVDLFEEADWVLPDKIIKKTEEDLPLVYQIYNINLLEANVRHLVWDVKEEASKAAERFDDKSVDFVFLDAGHRYEFVRSDIDAWLPKISTNGIISGHDWGASADVRRAVHETFDKSSIIVNGTCWCVDLRKITNG